MNALEMVPLKELADPYVAYSYSYPHKSAYGPLEPPVSLDKVWQTENKQSLFLYAHLPFCEMRCGFCNLFTRAGGTSNEIDLYLDSIERQARRMAQATAGDRTVTRLALGGGTPTVLSVAQLDRLFQTLASRFDFDPTRIPSSVETSPKTATNDRLQLLKQWNVQRISIGVQSFLDTETHNIGRPQQLAEVHAALQRIQSLSFPILNIDLIYGQPQQNIASWHKSLDNALQYEPEEIFLYPLYVRPETGLGKRRTDPRSSQTMMLYQVGRDKLLDAGYQQRSMRCFSRESKLIDEGPTYCCQSDGMLGLGAGARSYSSKLHYSSRFAVDAAGVRTIIDEWVQRGENDFAFADWGIRLSDEERQRRYIIQSLLHHTGLDRGQFINRFAIEPETVVPGLSRYIDNGLICTSNNRLQLTEEGMALSDAIGPALYSQGSRDKLAEFTLL